MRRPIVMSIAGYDPCAGAGVLADVKTMEQHKVYGLAVCTSLTFQNEDTFVGVDWITFEKIKQQIELQFQKYKIEYIKIGLIESLPVLKQVVFLLKALNPAAKIIWDPILKASAGFQFHDVSDKILLDEILTNIYLITPNIPEIQKLTSLQDSNDALGFFSEKCHVLLKGGHSENNEVKTDILQLKNGEKFQISTPSVDGDKHGTGCVLSSAIIANLALSCSLLESCHKAKTYISSYLKSEEGLLGYHAF